MTGPAISALIRCRDEEQGIGPLIDTLRAQTVPVELVVVDSGSRDGTLEEVRRRGIAPIEISPESFTFGHALNVAAAAATSDLCVAISAHALPESKEWAGRMAGALAEERVCCAFGVRIKPDLTPLEAPLLQDLALAERHPLYGYSNSAGGFRRALWEERPFDERLPACEDKEWALHWLRRGMVVRLDPELTVWHEHPEEGPVRSYRRVRGDVAAFRHFMPLEPISLGEVLTKWWSGRHLHRSSTRARLDPRRIAMLAGEWVGARGQGQRR